MLIDDKLLTSGWLAAIGQLAGALFTALAVIVALGVAFRDGRARKRDEFNRATAQAELVIEKVVADLPSRKLTKLANTVLATSSPDPERAVELGLHCIAAARSTGSVRITKELHTLQDMLTRRWPTFCGTAEFRDALAAA